MSITSLERLGDKLGVGIGGTLLNLSELGGNFELSEALGHGRNDS
jgi:hypothetical protein